MRGAIEDLIPYAQLPIFLSTVAFRTTTVPHLREAREETPFERVTHVLFSVRRDDSLPAGPRIAHLGLCGRCESMSPVPAALPVPTPPEVIEQPGLKKGAGSGDPPAQTSKKDYKGFVAGVFSGITKLSGKFLGLNGRQLLFSYGI